MKLFGNTSSKNRRRPPEHVKEAPVREEPIKEQPVELDETPVREAPRQVESAPAAAKG